MKTQVVRRPLSKREQTEAEKCLKWLQDNRADELLQELQATRLKKAMKLRDLGFSWQAIAEAAGVSNSALVQQAHKAGLLRFDPLGKPVEKAG